MPTKIFGTREAKEIELLSGADPASVAGAPDANVASNAEYIGGFDKVSIKLRGTALAGAGAGGSFWVQVSDSATPIDDAWVTHYMRDFEGSTAAEKSDIAADGVKMLYFASNDYAPYVRVTGTFSVAGSYYATLVATST